MGIELRIYSGECLLLGITAGYDQDREGFWGFEIGFLIFGLAIFWKQK
jgi:hypothetical protein